MKLLLENTDTTGLSFNDFNVIVEQTSPREPQKIIIEGPYIACDVVNVNGRTYKLAYFDNEVIPEYMNTWVKPHRAYAELNHAQSHVVDPKNACELITDLRLENNTYIGKSVVLNSDTRLGTPGTPNGDILAALLIHGGKIGKSTRGAVDDPKNKIIDENNKYFLITIDTVLDPSGPGCYINDIVYEEKDYMIDKHGLLVECAYSNLENKLNKYTATADKKVKQEKMLKLFSEFLKDIRQ